MNFTCNASAVRPAARSAVSVRCAAQPERKVVGFAKAAGLGVASFALALQVQAAEVKLGATGGALVFDPATITIKAGDSVTWKNNVGFPHNVVFDEDDVPGGVNAEALSHEDYLNAPGEEVSTKFTTPGTYGYYCEPHQGAGMVGKVVVQ